MWVHTLSAFRFRATLGRPRGTRPNTNHKKTRVSSTDSLSHCQQPTTLPPNPTLSGCRPFREALPQFLHASDLTPLHAPFPSQFCWIAVERKDLTETERERKKNSMASQRWKFRSFHFDPQGGEASSSDSDTCASSHASGWEAASSSAPSPNRNRQINRHQRRYHHNSNTTNNLWRGKVSGIRTQKF